MTDVSGSNELVIRRLFDAPPELVFACWADATHLARWGGAPEGFTVTIERQDIRVGGGFKIGMRSPDGNTFWLQGRYREITEPVRIAFTHAWLGEDGHPAPETLVTIELRPHGKGTELTLRQTGLPSKASCDGHGEGWNSTLDRLADHLERMRKKR